jgi:hypothetical protein
MMATQAKRLLLGVAVFALLAAYGTTAEAGVTVRYHGSRGAVVYSTGPSVVYRGGFAVPRGYPTIRYRRSPYLGSRYYIYRSPSVRFYYHRTPRFRTFRHFRRRFFRRRRFRRHFRRRRHDDD